MTLQVAHVEIETIYGKLTVPLKDIRSIEFGVRPPPDTAEKIGQAVKKLSSGDEGQRGHAGQTLLELGPYSYRAVLAVSQAANVEQDLKRRAQDVLKKLEQKFAKKVLATPHHEWWSCPK